MRPVQRDRAAQRLICRDPARAAIIEQIDAAMDKLQPKLGCKPSAKSEARLILLHAIEDYTKSAAFAGAVQEATKKGFSEFDCIATAAGQLADSLTALHETSLFALRVDNAPALISYLREIAAAAAVVNIKTLDEQAYKRPSGTPQNEKAITLAQIAAVQFHAITGNRAAITKATQEGRKARTGKALDFVNQIFAAAGIKLRGEASYYLSKAKCRIDAVIGPVRHKTRSKEF